MRYAPPGLCVNDFDLLRHADGTYTVLHLQGPWTAEFDHLRMETSYGRATSADLVHWEPQGTAFGNGLPGRFDQQAVWTMHAFPHGIGMAMLYTAVSGLTPDGWPLQSVGLAYSERTDGTGWRRHGTGPVVEADPRWYRTGERMGWRDPFVVRDDESDGWVMILCAADASLPVDVSGCVAWATSDDLEHWTVHPPLVSPATSTSWSARSSNASTTAAGCCSAPSAPPGASRRGPRPACAARGPAAARSARRARTPRVSSPPPTAPASCCTPPRAASVSPTSATAAAACSPSPSPWSCPRIRCPAWNGGRAWRPGSARRRTTPPCTRSATSTSAAASRWLCAPKIRTVAVPPSPWPATARTSGSPGPAEGCWRRPFCRVSRRVAHPHGRRVRRGLRRRRLRADRSVLFRSACPWTAVTGNGASPVPVRRSACPTPTGTTPRPYGPVRRQRPRPPPTYGETGGAGCLVAWAG
ncbi:mucin-1 [Streptomyces sp. INA 01156]